MPFPENDPLISGIGAGLYLLCRRRSLAAGVDRNLTEVPPEPRFHDITNCGIEWLAMTDGLQKISASGLVTGGCRGLAMDSFGLLNLLFFARGAGGAAALIVAFACDRRPIGGRDNLLGDAVGLYLVSISWPADSQARLDRAGGKQTGDRLIAGRVLQGTERVI